MPEAGLRFDVALRLEAFELQAALSVAPGETVALVGPSGSGKSTCLALIAGLLRPDAGSVACAGETWCDTARGLFLPPEARHVGLLFQDYALFPHLSVGDNVAYGARARGAQRAAADRAAGRVIESLGLGGLEGRSVGTLSGGQRQRVALARALCAGPRTLLLDEPFGALDVSTRGALRSELRRFLAGSGLPALLVTHDPVDALAFGDRIAVLEAGRLTQVGSRDALLAEPRSAFVADLAGLNLYQARIASGRGLKEARVGATVFHVLADEIEGGAFLAFAPSEVVLSAQPAPGSPQNVFGGQVIEMLPMSDRLRLVLDVGVVLAAEVTREAAAALDLAVGRRTWASVKATAIRVYG